MTERTLQFTGKKILIIPKRQLVTFQYCVELSSPTKGHKVLQCADNTTFSLRAEAILKKKKVRQMPREKTKL